MSTNRKRGLDFRRMLLGTFIFAGTLFLGISTTQIISTGQMLRQYQFLLNHVSEKRNLAKEMNLLMFEARLFQDDFLLTFESHYVDLVEEMVQKMLKVGEEMMLNELPLENMYQEYEAQEGETYNNQLTKIISEVENYHRQFINVVDLETQKGLDPESGDRGHFRSAAHSVEEQFNRYNQLNLNYNYLMLRRHEKDYIIRGDIKYYDRAIAQIELLRDLTSRSSIPRSGKDSVYQELEKYQVAFNNLVERDQEIESSLRDLNVIVARLLPLLEEELDISEILLEWEKGQLTKQARRTALIALIAIFSSIGLLVLVFASLSRNLSGALKLLLPQMEQFSQGDLNTEFTYDKKNELGEISSAMNQSTQAFRELIRQAQSRINDSSSVTDNIAVMASQTAASATEIAATIQSIDQRSNQLNQEIIQSVEESSRVTQGLEGLNQLIEEQSSSLEESNSAIEEITSTIHSVSRIAEERSKAAQRLEKITLEGGDQVEGTQQRVKEIAQLTEDILQVTEVIDSISSQTNLLSMNAAIEAAHAGEEGKGFGVVADEIRKLAEESAMNAKEIGSKLRDIEERIQGAEEAANESTRAFTGIQQEVEEFTKALAEIVASLSEMALGSGEVLDSSRRLGQIMMDVKGGSKDMMEALGKISSSLKKVEGLSTETAQATGEINRAIREIDQSTLTLNDSCQENQELMRHLGDSLKDFTV